MREIYVEAELVANEVEHLVVVCVLHEVGARPNVCRVWSLRDELEVELVARGSDAVGSLEPLELDSSSNNCLLTSIVGSLNGTVCSASIVVGTKGLVPGISVEAVGVAVGGLIVEPGGDEWEL